MLNVEMRNSIDGCFEEIENTNIGVVKITNEDLQFIEIAMRQELLVILAKNKYLQSFINDKYNSDYTRYYEAYIKEGKDFCVERKSMLDIAAQDSFNKLVGILMANEDSFEKFSENDFRLELIKRGYRDIYRQVKSMRIFDIYEVVNKYSNKYKKSKFSTRELAELSIISYAVAVSEDIGFTPLTCKYLARYCEKSVTSEMVYSKVYVAKGKNNRLVDVIPKDILNSKKYKLLADVLNTISSDSINDAIMADAMEYYVEYMQSIGVDIELFAEGLSYTEEDIKILTTFLNYDTSYILTDDSKKAIFSALLMLLALKKRYDEAKNIVLNTNAESRFRDALEYKENIQQKEAELDEKMEIYLSEIKTLKNELNNRDKEIVELKKQIKKQQDIINKGKDNSTELLSLRKAIYSINNSVDLELKEEDDINLKIDLMKEAIKDEKIIVFGGGPKWIKILKEELPSYTYFGAEDINRDISCIKKCKTVYINTQVLSHGFYYKIISEAAKHGVDIEYITQTDKVSVVKQIFENVKNNNK